MVGKIPLIPHVDHGNNGNFTPEDSDNIGPAAFVAALAELCCIAMESIAIVQDDVTPPRRIWRPPLKVHSFSDFKVRSTERPQPNSTIQDLLHW